MSPKKIIYISQSVSQFNPSFVSDSLRPHGLQHIIPPCPSPTTRACSNSCSLSQWCHPTISSSVTPFFSCLQFFLTSVSFPMSQLLASGGPSASASILPMNIHGWFPLGWTGLISCCPKDSSTQKLWTGGEEARHSGRLHLILLELKEKAEGSRFGST